MRQTRRKITKEVEKIEYSEIKRRMRVLPKLHPGDQTAYWNYRKHTKHNNKIGKNRSLYSKTVTAIWQSIAELLPENEGGVFLKDYGYFNGTIIPHKNKGITLLGAEDPYFHTDGYVYTLMLYSKLPKRSCIRGMIMDRTFDYRVKKNYSNALFNDLRPKLYKTTLESIHGYKKML